MSGSIARTVTAGLSWFAVFCAALALLPSDATQDGSPSHAHGDLISHPGVMRVADDDDRQARNAQDSVPPATSIRTLENAHNRTTDTFRTIPIANCDHPQKNNRAAAVPYGQHANPAGSATQPSTGNIAVDNATIQTGPASAGMTFAADGGYWGITEHMAIPIPLPGAARAAPGATTPAMRSARPSTLRAI